MIMEIVNREIYTARMRAGMEDKLWWVDKTNAEIVVDYGCADGSMLQILHEAVQGFCPPQSLPPDRKKHSLQALRQESHIPVLPPVPIQVR